MVVDLEKDVQRRRANVYKLLSVLYNQPTEDTGDLLQNLKEDSQYLYPDINLYVDIMIEDFQLNASDLTELKVDHAKLFIGPFDVLASPYSTIYIDGGRQVMGESTLVAKEHYYNAGLSMDKGFKDVPDHISVELEFMYYLIFQFIKTEDSKFIESQSSFLVSHLGLWINPFTDRIIERANTDFYKNLGLITSRFIDQELQVLVTK